MRSSTLAENLHLELWLVVYKEAVEEDKVKMDKTAEGTTSNSRIRTKVVRINAGNLISSSRASRLRQMVDSKVGMQLKVGKMVKEAMKESSGMGLEMPSAASAENLRTRQPPVTIVVSAVDLDTARGNAVKEDPPDWNRNRGA